MTLAERAVRDFRRRYWEAQLLRYDWNVSAVARAEGVERQTIYGIIGRLGIKRPAPHSPTSPAAAFLRIPAPDISSLMSR